MIEYFNRAKLLVSVQLQEIIKNNDFLVFTNPVYDKLNINTLGNYEKSEIEIYNIKGEEVLKSEYREIVDLSGLASGIYFIKIGNIIHKFNKYRR